MEGSVQTEQALLQELHILRTRVAELEQAAEERQQVLLQEQEARSRLETTVKTLRESTACFRRLFESNIIAIASADLQGHIIEANGVFLQMLGYTREELLAGSMRWDHLTPPEFQALDEQAIGELKAYGICTPFEKQYLHKDGHRVSVQLGVAMLEGSQDQCIAYILDLTRRKHLEEAVRETARRAEGQARELATVFETLTDAVAVYDHEGRIVRMNTAFRALLGLDGHPEYASHPLDERTFWVHMRDVHGQFLAREQWPVQRILKGELLSGENTTDVRLSTLDERQVLLNISGAPMHDEQGQISGAVIIFRDVTERRQLERRTHGTLKALLAMAEVLVEGTDRSSAPQSAPSSLAQVIQRLVKLSRRVLDCRSVSITLVEAETEILHPVATIGTSIEEKQQWQAALEGTRLSDHFIDPRMLDALHAGKPLTFDVTCRPSFFHAGDSLLMPMHVGAQLVGLLSLDYGSGSHDFTGDEVALAEAVSKLTALVLERERLLKERAEAHANELALLEASRRMDEFLSIASHELRTPLTAIKGNLQLARRRLNAFAPPDEPEKLDEQFDLIYELLSRAERQVSVQNRLVGDLLDVSRIQANRLDLNINPADLVAIVHETVEDQRAATPSRSISLEMPDLDMIPILADADRISQVVSNYLTNALKYSEASRPVAVRVSVQDGVARVSVRDQGPGLAPQEQTRLWQRFYRVPGISVRSGTGVGLGLGLHICRTIIERHNGQVGVESMPGEGSTFWFTLPITTKE